MFYASDVAGNSSIAGPYAILVDTMEPTGLSVVAAYQSSITVQWNLVTGATGYTLVASTNSAYPLFPIWASSTTVGVGDNSDCLTPPLAILARPTFLFVQSNYNAASSTYALW